MGIRIPITNTHDGSITYEEIDYPDETIRQMDLKRLAEAEVCDRCKKNKPDQIIKFSSYIVACQECADHLRASLAMSIEESRKDQEAY